MCVSINATRFPAALAARRNAATRRAWAASVSVASAAMLGSEPSFPGRSGALVSTP